MQYVELIAIATVLQFFFFTYMTGDARRRAKLAAPAMTGDVGFERMYRVQMNSLEIMVIFLPALMIAGKYWSSLVIAALGVVYLIGRFIYWRAYVTDPSKRAPGFLISIAVTAILILLAILGILGSL